MNKMRRGVIPPGSVALFDIDCRDNEVANPERTIFHRYFMNDEPGDRRISIIYFRGEFPRSNFADVADLPVRSKPNPNWRPKSRLPRRHPGRRNLRKRLPPPRRRSPGPPAGSSAASTRWRRPIRARRVTSMATGTSTCTSRITTPAKSARRKVRPTTWTIRS